MINKEIDMFALALACLGGFVGGFARTLFSLENVTFRFVKLIIDCGIGLIVGLLVGSICLNYEVSIYWLLAASISSGMLGKESVDIILEKFKKKNDLTLPPTPLS
jgi:hypothetical protein